MSPDIAGYLATTSGMTDEHRVSQIECFDECCQIIGVGIQVVAVPGLAGSPVSATIMGDGTITMRGHEEQLVVPGVGIERPSVTENDGLSRAPILVKNRSSVLCSDCTRTHRVKFSFQ